MSTDDKYATVRRIIRDKLLDGLHPEQALGSVIKTLGYDKIPTLNLMYRIIDEELSAFKTRRRIRVELSEVRDVPQEEPKPMRYEFRTKNLHVPSVAEHCTVDAPLIRMVTRSDTSPPTVVREALIHRVLLEKADYVGDPIEDLKGVLIAEFIGPHVMRVTLEQGQTYAPLIAWARRVKYTVNYQPLVHVVVEEVEL